MCGTELTDDNISDEHIILNGLGGHLHSTKLICPKCNNSMGSSSDKKLAETFRLLVTMLDIPRQNGENPVIRTGREYNYNVAPKGRLVPKKPEVEKHTLEDGRTMFEVRARSEQEARNIAASISKKHPSVDVEEVMNGMKHAEKQVSEKITFDCTINGPEIFPSIAKTAVEFYLFKGGEAEQIKHWIPVLREEKPCSDVFYFYPSERIFPFPKEDGKIMHILHVCGDTDERILYAYVSLFDVLQCLVVLNYDYFGMPLSFNYAYNVLDKKNENLEAGYRLTRKMIEKASRPDKTSLDALAESYKLVMWKAVRRMTKEYMSECIDKAITQTMNNHSSEKIITQEMIDEFISHLLAGLNINA